MATNVDVKKKIWGAGPLIRLASGWLTADGNGDEYVNPDGPFGVVVFGAAAVQAHGSLSLQLQHRALSGDSWANVGSALSFSVAGEQFAAISGVLARVRVVRDLTGVGAKYLISQAAIVQAAPSLTPQDLDSGSATVADVIAALVELGLVTDIA